MDSEFEGYLLQLLRQRASSEWKLQVCEAALGLCASVTGLAGLRTSWPVMSAPSVGQQFDVLASFERFRALCYYQLDQRPAKMEIVPIPEVDLDEVLAGLSAGAGQLANAVSGWLFRGEPVEAASKAAFAHIERYRTALYGHLELRPADVWQQVERRPLSHVRRVLAPSNWTDPGNRSAS